jgi:hypothetical protein
VWGATAGSAAATGAASCGDPSKNTASAPGITKDTITIAMITSATGNASSTFVDTSAGANARIQAQNASRRLATWVHFLTPQVKKCTQVATVPAADRG